MSSQYLVAREAKNAVDADHPQTIHVQDTKYQIQSIFRNCLVVCPRNLLLVDHVCQSLGRRTALRAGTARVILTL